MQGIEYHKTSHRQRQIFTLDEDKHLLELVEEFGQDWRKIAKSMTNRSTRQCRERYRNYLAPDIKNGPWTNEEDHLLEHKVMELGQRWSMIAKFFPTRSDINIKNRWSSIKNKMLRNEQKDYTMTYPQDQYMNQMQPMMMAGPITPYIPAPPSPQEYYQQNFYSYTPEDVEPLFDNIDSDTSLFDLEESIQNLL